VTRLLEEGLDLLDGPKIRSEYTDPGKLHVTEDTWGIPPFEAALRVFADEHVPFPGDVTRARAVWFDRWRRPPALDLDVLLRTLRADCREWRKREDRYVPAFAKWLQSGRETLAPELLPGGQATGSQYTLEARLANASRADEQRNKHDDLAARVGLCWCAECRAAKESVTA